SKKARREPRWKRGIDTRVASLKGRGDGTRQSCRVKGKLHGKSVKVIKVLHAAVALAEDDQGVKLFCNDRFVGIRPNIGSWSLKGCRIRHVVGSRFDCIAKTNIDLHVNPSGTKRRLETQPEPMVLGFVPDRRGSYCRPIERKPVVWNR